MIFCLSGIKVVCPRCQAHIATVLNDLYCNAPMRKHDFKFKEGHYPHDNSTSCGVCRTLYIQYGKLHTECGWIGGNTKLNYNVGMDELIKSITEVK